MLKLRAFLLAGMAVLLTAPSYQNHVLCEGYLPPNDMRIPVSDAQAGGITKADFDDVLNLVENYYRPIVQSKGGRLVVNREWNNAEVNASAQQMFGTWTINMYGGLARFHSMTKDGFLMVACHEMGHHLGGAPKVPPVFFGDAWATNEGGADYFATLRCMRILFKEAETAKFVQENQIDPALRAKCEQVYNTQAEENTCMRAAIAGFVGSSLFHELSKETTPLRYDTPDRNVVSKMFDGHPKPQCRLDTYFQGALCLHDMSVELSNTNYAQGTCVASASMQDGIRPLCWFKP